jgi:hypothetical protein
MKPTLVKLKLILSFQTVLAEHFVDKDIQITKTILRLDDVGFLGDLYVY